MLELKAVADRLGLSEHSARRLLRALAPMVDDHIKRGKDNRLLIQSGALAILDRAASLWSDGQTLQDLSKTIQHELGKASTDHANGLAPNRENPASDHHCGACDVRDQMIQELRADKARLLEQLDTAQDQVRAMLPSVSEGRRRMGRWAHLRAVVLGR